MTRFIKYCGVFLLPFFVIICLYFIFDPFKVLKHYDNYFSETGGSVNRGFVSTMNYLNKKDTYHYDSFIFGNSRSLYYMIDDWKQYIPKESSCYHFSEFGGSIQGIVFKLRLIDKSQEKINNALIIIDHEVLNKIHRDGAIYTLPPALTNNSNWFQFHTEQLSQWLNPLFLSTWMRLKLRGEYDASMKGFIENGANYPYYNPITNEEPRHIEDSLIAKGVYFTDSVIAIFHGKHRPQTYRVLLDNDEKRLLLEEMRDILVKHHTNYKIIISPLYDQKKLNPQDLAYLKEVFGKNNVFDFSGVNEYTSDYHNYYENSHYLPSVARDIMSKVYNQQAQ